MCFFRWTVNWLTMYILHLQVRDTWRIDFGQRCPVRPERRRAVNQSAVLFQALLDGERNIAHIVRFDI